MFRATVAIATVINGVGKIADYVHKSVKGLTFVKRVALTPIQFSWDVPNTFS